jgi:hypothetical protein
VKIKVSEVVFRKDLYPRIEHNQAKAQEYSENIEHLPPIEVNQHKELIDGFHRWTAHKLAGVDEIEATETQTESDNQLLEFAIERNNDHGLQMSMKDKKELSQRLYTACPIEKRGPMKDRLPKLMSVAYSTIQGWLSDIDGSEIERRNATILQLHLNCWSQQEIGDAVGMTSQGIGVLLKQFTDLESVSNLDETEAKRHPVKTECVELAKYQDDEFQIPIYNVWAFGKKTNETGHFGNTEQRIVDNLLWLYTEPFDTVFDPFGGGGSTLDVCEKRLRRCWISDRKPKPGMEDKLRTMDVCNELPSIRWSDVSLTYLDPPYWRQAENEYSTDAEDLANMPLDEFTEKMVGIVKRIAAKQSKGVIALIIQPTQWRAEPKGAFADHVFDIVQGVAKVKNLTVENRISCPYSSEQCAPQMVNWSKENKKPLVLSRELVVWRVA